MPNSDKNTKVNKTQLSELYFQSRGRHRPGNIITTECDDSYDRDVQAAAGAWRTAISYAAYRI